MPTLSPSSTVLLQRLQAIAEETRLHLVRMLAGGERCVCELQEDLGGAAQSRLSFHLRKLKEAGLVSDRRDGRWVYYSLVPGALEELQAFLAELRPWAGAGAAVPSPGRPRPSGREPGASSGSGEPHPSRGSGACC